MQQPGKAARTVSLLESQRARPNEALVLHRASNGNQISHRTAQAQGHNSGSTFGGLRVKPSPTNVTFVSMRFHALPARTYTRIARYQLGHHRHAQARSTAKRTLLCARANDLEHFRLGDRLHLGDGHVPLAGLLLPLLLD